MRRSLRATGAAATAVQSAARARAWLQPFASRRAIVSRAGRPLPRAVVDRLIDEPRICARTDDLLADLVELLRSEPDLGPWIERPDALAKLHLHVGAANCGALLRTFVHRDAVATIVERIGRQAWTLALRRHGSATLLATDPQDALATVELEGASAVLGYFRVVAPGLLPTLEAGTGVRWSKLADRDTTPADADATRAVIAELGP